MTQFMLQEHYENDILKMGTVAYFDCNPDPNLQSKGAIPYIIKANTCTIIIFYPVLPWLLSMHLALFSVSDAG